MARGRKTGGRTKGIRNKVTEEARIVAAASGIMPLDYMLQVMRDPKAESTRRDAMASAAAPYLHRKQTPSNSLNIGVGGVNEDDDRKLTLEFVLPNKPED